MQLEPGMRVRCVYPDEQLRKGAEYIVRRVSSGPPAIAWFNEGCWMASRFKPIFRVKMGRRFDKCCGYDGYYAYDFCDGCPCLS